jgi:uncharacterized membrane protein YfcA
MDITSILLLILLGGIAGVAGGLLGIGGGLIMTPSLFFYFRGVGIPDDVLTPLSIGTGLLCTWVISVSSAVHHHARGATNIRAAILCGLAAACAAAATSIWITTASWFTPALFQRVFAIFLMAVAVKMIVSRGTNKKTDGAESDDTESDDSRGTVVPLFPTLVGGTLAGTIASAVGIGGGMVLVPLYERFMKMKMHVAVGTSSATIVIITLAAVITFMARGPALSISASSIGYVDFKLAAILAIPAAMTTGLGVSLAHRMNRARLRQVFGALALLVSIRLFLGI